jgi:crotonobetainyl-CoA:carnitine CoA-transferase CaiB-like acyl-CoA transferase
MFETSNDAPLAGVIVVEHGKGVAASYAGRILALMGATVIKLEAPGVGDPLRYEPPLLGKSRDSGALFSYLNLNKTSVTLDVSRKAGLDLLDELLDRATVFLDDTHPADRSSWAIAPADVCERHSRLIYCSVLPFGAAGAHSDYRAYELNVFHSGGEGYLLPNGLAIELFPERPPVKVYGHFAQFVGGTSAVCATLAALLVHAEVSGQFLDVSVQDANVALSCFNIQRLGEGVLENRHARSFQYGGVLECSDGYVQILTLEQHQWEGLVKLMGDPLWAMQPCFRDSLDRGRRGAEINKHLRAWARTQAVEDLVRRGQALSVPLAKYAEPADILASEQSRVRNMFIELDMPGLGPIQMLTAPFQFTLPSKVSSYPAQPGADNSKIICDWLGHSRPELERWTSEQVV